MHHDIIRLTTRHAWHKDKLCEKLGLNFTQLKKAIKEANAEGYAVRDVDGFIQTRSPAIHAETKPIILGSTRPGRHHVAIVTDLHAGSNHFHSRGLLRFLDLSWSFGCRVAVSTGDVLDGNKPVLLPDQLRAGWDGQVSELTKTLTKAPPFKYVAIDGNHDGYFSASSGTTSGRQLETTLRGEGLDWTFAGVCLGRAKIHGADWHLWHPHGGAGTRNAIRRILNERIEALEEPAHIVAMGHFHKFATVAAYPERVFGVAGGTFQEKRSEFANRISRGWDVGGTIVSYTLSRHGVISEISAEFYPVGGASW